MWDQLAALEQRETELWGLMTGTPCRVFFGDLIKSEKRSMGDAARDGFYSTFFDKNGNFKRHSVFQR
jgi:hypothetical protein